MLARLKRATRLIALLLALPVGAVVAFGLYVVVKLATYEQRDDASHMASKQVYLQTLAGAAKPKNAPDVVIILFDDLGHGDVGFMGNQMIATPHMDALAKKAVVLENYYAPAPVCSPSRAAMLTGRLPSRNLLTAVPFPNGHFVDRINRLFGNPVRLPREEIILSDVLKASGYHTAMVGKWHMGDHDKSIPTEFGFERFFGTYHSNDMTPFHLVEGTPAKGETIAVAAPVDQTQLNRLYAEKSETFIAAAPKNQPMFLYLAHNFPHVPLHAAAHEHGRSDAGLYGDVVQGLDDTVGRVVAALKKRGTLDNTLLIITSDNGPWWQGKGIGRGRKGQSFEGGVHVPFLAHWPAQLAPRRSPALAMGTDLLPTIMAELNLPAPTDRLLDGRNIASALRGGASPHDVVYYYGAGTLMAVRDAKYKYRDAKPVIYATDPVSIPLWPKRGPWLHDLKSDPDESYDISMRHPQVAARLKAALDARNQAMAENPRGWK
ncbi:MAG: sulfatase-like hydrolase/transferase [Rhodobiaceae bacterium]|jgi:arylsulfatase A-like enzyme|nr:sulfatase-like hydrolase/transferase [Rhodobiaceae bacterium]